MDTTASRFTLRKNAERSPMSNHEARADAGSILRHRPLTYRIVKEI